MSVCQQQKASDVQSQRAKGDFEQAHIALVIRWACVALTRETVAHHRAERQEKGAKPTHQSKRAAQFEKTLPHAVSSSSLLMSAMGGKRTLAFACYHQETFHSDRGTSVPEGVKIRTSWKPAFSMRRAVLTATQNAGWYELILG